MPNAAVWWILVIAAGVTLGIVVGGWLRRGGLLPPISSRVDVSVGVALAMAFYGFLVFSWWVGWIPRILVWIQSIGAT